MKLPCGYKMKYVTRYPGECATREDWERRAIEYAVWLANRRGITLPVRSSPAYAKAQWDHVSTRTKTGKHKFEERIRAVSWGYGGTRQRSYRGGWTYTPWHSELEIELPYWDWMPEVIDCSQPPIDHLAEIDAELSRSAA